MGKIRDLLNQIIEDGVLTREEHRDFIMQIQADGEVDDEEALEIKRLFQLISEGKVKVLDK